MKMADLLQENGLSLQKSGKGGLWEEEKRINFVKILRDCLNFID